MTGQFCCPPFFSVYIHVWLQAWCRTALGHQATRCPSVLFHKHTENSQQVSLVFHLACRLLTWHCIVTVTGALGSAQQGRQSGESSITVKTQGHTKSWIGVGGVGFCLCVVLFQIGRFHCGVVFTVAIVLNSGQCWRDGMSYKVHRFPVHHVCRRWLNTDDPAAMSSFVKFSCW